MPVGGGRGTGGGGGLHFRRPADSFNGADIAEARTARDTFFGAMANAAALAEFQNDDFLAIVLTVTGVTGNVFETYTGSPGDAYDADLWVERTDAIQGDRGPGPTDAQIQANVKEFARAGNATLVGDADIAPEIMRDAEFTAAAVRTLLGLTAAEVNDLFVGASITDHTITVMQNDGTTLNIAVPDDSDGVVTAAALDGTTNVLTLTLSEGNPVTVDLSSLAGSGGVSLATVLAAIRAGTGIDIDRTTDNQITIAATGVPTPGDHSRRYAISEDEMLSDAEAMAAETSNSQRITGPAWGAGVQRYRFIGVPEAEDDITDIEQGGLSVFSAFEPYEDNNGDAIIVDGHKWWKDEHAVDGEFNSNQTLTIIQ